MKLLPTMRPSFIESGLRHRRTAGVIFALLFCVNTLVTNSFAQSEQSLSAGNLDTALPAISRVDEELFIVYALNHNYSNWPRTENKAGASLELQIGESQQFAQLLLERSRSLGSLELDLLAYQQVRLLNSYHDFLDAQGLISKAAAAASREEAGINIFGFGVTAVQSVLSKGGWPGLAVSAVLGVADWALASGRISEARAELLARERDRLIRDLEAQSDYFRKMVFQLAERNQWDKDLVRFDSELAKSNNPFVLADEARSIGKYTKPYSKVTSAVNGFVRTAKMIPPASEYDALRVALLDQAADFASSAALNSFTDNPPHAYDQSVVEAGLLACDWRRDMGFALNANFVYDHGILLLAKGDSRAALGTMNQLFDNGPMEQLLQTDSDWSYNYACVCSQAGDQKAALAWVRQALELGSQSIAWYREDPDLEPLRRELPEEFTELTVPVGHGDVDTWMIRESDFEFENRWDFPMTNVKGQPVVIMKDGTRHRLNLVGDRIEPGEIALWMNVFPLSKRSQIDSIEMGTWSCDQSYSSGRSSDGDKTMEYPIRVTSWPSE